MHPCLSNALAALRARARNLLTRDLAKFEADSSGKSESRELIFRARALGTVYKAGQLEVSALSDVSFDLFQSEWVVLLGPSGSGKSTLLNILGGIDSASSGSVFFRDHDLVQADSRALTRYRREHVGFVFQFYNLIPTLTAIENIRRVTELAASYGARCMDPLEALRSVGLENRADFFPSQLSGGEQQRISIARALAKMPDILLCDEPTGALDVETGKLVLGALVRANRELGTPVVVITHNAAISGLADRVIRLAGGRVRDIHAPPCRIPVSEVEW